MIKKQNGNQFSMEKKAVIFTEMKRERSRRTYGFIGRVKNSLAEHHQMDVTYGRLQKMKTEFADDGWTLQPKQRRPGAGRKRKLSTAGFRSVIAQAKNTNARRLVKKRKFEAANGEMVKISRLTVRNYVKGKLVLSIPKMKGIRTHFDHHRRMRVFHAQWYLSLSPTQRLGVWYSDEMAWYIGLKPNTKNDVIYVEPGEQSKTNIVRMHKGDSSQIFSMWWTVNKGGVVAVRLYEVKMTVEFFKETLNDFLKEKIPDFQRSRQKLRWWYHDHVTNSSKLYDEETMNDVLGEGKWLQFSPAICREQDGHITIAATNKRREHLRKNMVPKTHCECEPTAEGKHVPSSSPDLNLAEYAQGMLRTMLLKAVRSNEVEWKGNAKKKMMIIRQLVNELNQNKQFWRKLYEGHEARCQCVVDTKGDLT